MQNRISVITIVLTILVASILPIIHIAIAVDTTLTLSDSELGTQFAYQWGPPSSSVTIVDIAGPGVRCDFLGLSTSGTAVGDNYPVSQLAGGALDGIGGWGDFRAYTQYRLVFTNLGPNPVSVNLFMNTGFGSLPNPKDTYWENGWIYIETGKSKIVTIDFSSATAWNALDDPVVAWRYSDGTAAVLVRRLSEVSNIGFQVCGSGAGSLVVSSTTPSDDVSVLPDEELGTQFAKETGPGTLEAITDMPGLGVRFDFNGLSTSAGTLVGDSFPLSALAGGEWKDYGNGFAGPYDFSACSRLSMVFTNVGTNAVTVNLKMNTGWTDPPWGSHERDSFWQGSWTFVPPGESRVLVLDFWKAEVWNAADDPTPQWQYPDGTNGVIVRRLDEVSNLGFQVLGADVASIVVSGQTVLTLSDAELYTQFSKESGPGNLAALADIPGPGVRFDFTGLATNVGTVLGDNFPVSSFAGGAYKTYGVTSPFSTWGDFFEYTEYSMMFTNLGPSSVTVNLKMNTAFTIPPPEYAAAWRDTFWQTSWTTIPPGETKTITMNLSSAEVYNAADEEEYKPCPDGTAGVAVWRLDEISDIGFQILGNSAASIIVTARPQPNEVYVDGSFTSLTPGWGYDHFAMIQEGIDAVAIDGTVHVHDGTYNENLDIKKPLTLTSASWPIIDGGALGNCITINANNIVVNGFEIRNGYNGITGETSGSTFSRNIIHDNLNIPRDAGVGILLWGDNDGNAIEENAIYENDRQGIFIGYQDDTKISAGNTIRNNKIYHNGLYRYPNPPDASNYGIQLWFADDNTITGNEVYGHDDWFPYEGFDFAQGIYLCDANHNTVTSNYLSGNNYGVGLWHPTRAVLSNDINYNNIVGNTGYGVRTFDGPPNVNALYNWWGDNSGPSGTGSGTGDKVGSKVDYDPWLRLFDSVEIGNVSQEAGHGFQQAHDGDQGWSYVVYPTGAGGPDGYYGGTTKPLRVVWEMPTPDESKREAELKMFAYTGMPKMLEMDVLDGQASNSFDVYAYQWGSGWILVYHYEAMHGAGGWKGSQSEVWRIHKIPLDGFDVRELKLKIVALGPAWSEFARYGQLAIRKASLYGYYVPSNLERCDYVKLGDSVSEAGHEMTEWGDSVAPGTINLVPGHWGYPDDTSYFGYDGGQAVPPLRTVWGRSPDNTRYATIAMDAKNKIASLLVFSALDGVADDSFEVVVNGILVYQYSANPSWCGWIVHRVDLTSLRLGGVLDINITATGQQWSSWDTYGQLSINWIEVWGAGEAVHDVAITSVVASPSTVLVGDPVAINVTAANLGNVLESFTVTAYYDGNAISAQTVNNLPPTSSIVLVFNWDTTGVQTGNYTIKAEAGAVPGETNTANNVLPDGVVEINPRQVTVHDVAVTDVTVPTNETYQGWIVSINVTVANLGDTTESFIVTLYYGNTIVGTQPVSNLPPSAELTLSFAWNTTQVPACINYTIRAVASGVPFETNTSNNFLIDGQVHIKIFGDINGDGYVNAKDAVQLGLAFCSQQGGPAWNPQADLNQDGYINAKDAILLGQNFGAHCP
jgi:parallel beta-helix repeat protein